MRHLGRFPPLAPMRGPHVDTLLSLSIDPTAKDATAWKRESVHAVITDDCEFKIAVKWRGGYRLPIHPCPATIPLKKYRAVSSYQIDLDQGDENAGLHGDAVGAGSEGATSKVSFLHSIDAPREGKA